MMGKEFANKGIERNKKPLKNIYYILKKYAPKTISNYITEAEYNKKFKIDDTVGYVRILWGYEGSGTDYWSFSVDLEYVKNQVTAKQWAKCMDAFKNKGVSEYKLIVQRRINNQNVKKNDKR